MTARQCYAYCDFFARVPGTLCFIGVMGFWIEYLSIRGNQS